MAEVAAGVVGNVAGGLFATKMMGSDKQPDIGEQITHLVNGMNSTLNTYLQKALHATEINTNQAIDVQKKGLESGTQTLNQYLDQATRQAQLNSLYGLQQSQAFAQPMINAGNTALDSYMDSLGLSRPVVGSNAVQQALVNKSMMNQGIAALGNAPNNPGSVPTAPTTPSNQISSYLSQLTPQQVGTFVNNHLLSDNGHNYYVGPGSTHQANGYTQYGYDLAGYGAPGMNTATNPIYQAASNALAQQLMTSAQKQYQTQSADYNKQLNTYNTNLNNYNQYQSQLGALTNMYGGANPLQQSILNAYNQGYFR